MLLTHTHSLSLSVLRCLEYCSMNRYEWISFDDSIKSSRSEIKQTYHCIGTCMFKPVLGLHLSSSKNFELFDVQNFFWTNYRLNLLDVIHTGVCIFLVLILSRMENEIWNDAFHKFNQLIKSQKRTNRWLVIRMIIRERWRTHTRVSIIRRFTVEWTDKLNLLNLNTHMYY